MPYWIFHYKCTKKTRFHQSVIIAWHLFNFASRKIDDKRRSAKEVEISAIKTNCSLESLNAYSSWNEVRLHLRMLRLSNKDQDNGWNRIFRLCARENYCTFIVYRVKIVLRIVSDCRWMHVNFFQIYYELYLYMYMLF